VTAPRRSRQRARAAPSVRRFAQRPVHSVLPVATSRSSGACVAHSAWSIHRRFLATLARRTTRPYAMCSLIVRLRCRLGLRGRCTGQQLRIELSIHSDPRASGRFVQQQPDERSGHGLRELPSGGSRGDVQLGALRALHHESMRDASEMLTGFLRSRSVFRARGDHLSRATLASSSVVAARSRRFDAQPSLNLSAGSTSAQRASAHTDARPCT
jgi:hypothetical protein